MIIWLVAKLTNHLEKYELWVRQWVSDDIPYIYIYEMENKIHVPLGKYGKWSLVGGWALPLWKIWKSVGVTIPYIWKVIKFMFQSTNQIYTTIIPFIKVGLSQSIIRHQWYQPDHISHLNFPKDTDGSSLTSPWFYPRPPLPCFLTENWGAWAAGVTRWWMAYPILLASFYPIFLVQFPSLLPLILSSHDCHIFIGCWLVVSHYSHLVCHITASKY